MWPLLRPWPAHTRPEQGPPPTHERAPHDAVSVCARCNFMNRFVKGPGGTADDDCSDTSGTGFADGYTGLKGMMWLCRDHPWWSTRPNGDPRGWEMAPGITASRAIT